MSRELFFASWHGTWTSVLQKAAADVEKLDRKAFSDPSLGGLLNKIAQKYSFDIAAINKEGIAASRRELERYHNDYGERRAVKYSVLEVTIPFSGEAESFKIMPSSSVIPNHTAELREGSLLLTIPDDANADATVLNFVSQLNHNLAALRKDYEQAKPQLEQAISAAAERRKQTIQKEQERDKKLSFPVRND
jgi:hypothetical protein